MKLKKALMVVVAFLGLSLTLQSSADIQTELNDWFGGYSNVTMPGAYQGQAGGYYTGGNFSIHVPNRDVGTFANVTMPSFSGGCGGIDLDMGGFNLVNKDQIIQQLRAIGQNAKALAFSMAIGYVSSLLSAKMGDVKVWADKLNSMQMSSCEAAQNILAIGAKSLTKEQETTDQMICMGEKITNSGMTPDEARTACTSGGGGADRNSTVKGMGNVGLFTRGNLAWFAMMQSPWLQTDLDTAELIMNLTGTVLVVEDPAQAGNEAAPQVKFFGMASIEGTSGKSKDSYELQAVVHRLVMGESTEGFQGDIWMFKCDSSDRNSGVNSCQKLKNNGKVEKLNFSTITPVVDKVKTRINSIYNTIANPDATMDTADRAFIEATTAPIYRYILASASAFPGSPATRDVLLKQYIESIARSMVAHNMATVMKTIENSLNNPELNQGDDQKKAMYLANVQQIGQAFVQIRGDAEKEMEDIIAIQERSQKYERVIISRMSASMLNSAMFNTR